MQCSFVKDDGKRCKAQAVKGSEFCYFHDPEKKTQLKESQSEGGKNRTVCIKSSLPKLDLKEPKDVVSLVADTIHRVRSGEMDVRIGNCLGILSGHLLKAMDVADLSKRVDQLEKDLSILKQ